MWRSIRWATRVGVHMDRAAYAWLVRWFVDPDAAEQVRQGIRSSFVSDFRVPAKGALAAPSEESADRGGVTAPVFLDHVGACRLHEAAQDEGGDDGVVEWAEEGDELGDEVYRRRDPGDTDEKQCLGAARHTGVAEEVFEQQHQVRQQGGHLASGGPSPGEDQRHDEQEVEDRDDAE